MGGNFTNLRGLMVAHQLFCDIFPKKLVRDDGSSLGSTIWGLDRKENLEFSKGGIFGGPHHSVPALNFDKYGGNRFEFNQGTMEGSWVKPINDNQYLLFYYDCD